MLGVDRLPGMSFPPTDVLSNHPADSPQSRRDPVGVAAPQAEACCGAATPYCAGLGVAIALVATVRTSSSCRGGRFRMMCFTVDVRCVCFFAVQHQTSALQLHLERHSTTR
jgi:hypothetical protein